MPPPAKTELRRLMRAQLARISSAAWVAASESIRSTISSLPRWQAARIIAGYAALPSEPNLQPFRWKGPQRWLLPRVEGDSLVFNAVENATELQPGSFGVAEPHSQHCPLADPSSADLIFVPGLAFTTQGHRLGRGGGYYDRLLSTLSPSVFRVGICLDQQLVKELPCLPHDEKVDLVLSSPA